MHRRSAAAAILAAFLGTWGAPGDARAQAGPFGGLAGVWTGNGEVTLSNGAKERIRCRATYAVSDSGSRLQQNLRCASDSYVFELVSTAQARGTALSGTWTETTRNVNGTLAGVVTGNQIQVTVQSSSFGAGMTISTSTNRQSVSIRAAGTELTGAVVILNRRG